ncbi:MAG: beta-lactamase domain protein [Conexibacter sp.]|nr:beta-lactamase domain protein [Conexibacter sp.]
MSTSDRKPRITRRRVALALTGLVVALAALWLTLARGSVRSLPRSAWEAPPPSARSWREVFDKAPRVELDSLDTGAVHVARRKMLAAGHPETATYREEPTPLRVYAHLIRHPTRGDFLVDSGLDASFAWNAYGNIQAPTRWVLALLYDAPYTQRPGEDVLAQLAQRGAHPRAVFFTHLHMDHTAGVPAMPADTELVAGKGEVDDPVQIFGYGHFASTRRLRELDFTDAPEMPPLGRSLDLFGDGSVWAVSTPGHTRGHVSFVVVARSGPVLLVGDASHFRWAFEHGVGPSGTSGSGDQVAQATLDRLRDFARAFPELTVFCGHEAPAPKAP